MPFKLTNNNIKLRLWVQQQKDPKFSLARMGEKFGVHRQVAWTWCSDNPKFQTLPGDRKCLNCGKSLRDVVYRWINDGSLDHLIPKKG